MTPQSRMEQLLAADVTRSWCLRQSDADSRFVYDEAHSGGSSEVRFAVTPVGGDCPVACAVQLDGGSVSLTRLDTDETKNLVRGPFDQRALEDALDNALAGIMGEQGDDGMFVEGAAVSVTLDRYERSRAARKACLDVQGTSCAICGFDFGKAYGEAFAGIIQVHHVIPVSERGGAYEVDPIRDLIPVCPNCHVALHSKPGGTYTPDELRAALAQRRGTNDNGNSRPLDID